jgi:hypothetical protein
MWVYSWNKINVFDNRYLSSLGLVLLVGAGLALSKVSKPAKLMIPALLGFGFSIPLVNQYFVYGYYDPWREAAHYLEQNVRPGEKVAVYPAWNETPLDYYLRGTLRLQGIPGTYDPISGETAGYFPIDPAHTHQLKSLFKPESPVWLLWVGEGLEQDWVRDWFADHYHPGRFWKQGGLSLQEWEPVSGESSAKGSSTRHQVGH